MRPFARLGRPAACMYAHTWHVTGACLLKQSASWCLHECQHRVCHSNVYNNVMCIIGSVLF